MEVACFAGGHDVLVQFADPLAQGVVGVLGDLGADSGYAQLAGVAVALQDPGALLPGCPGGSACPALADGGLLGYAVVVGFGSSRLLRMPSSL